MLSLLPTRTRSAAQLRRRLSTLAGAVFAACASPMARAAVVSAVPDCGATGGGWGCYLPGIYRFLLVIAILLGLILVAVIAVAVKSYFKIKHDEKVDS